MQSSTTITGMLKGLISLSTVEPYRSTDTSMSPVGGVELRGPERLAHQIWIDALRTKPEGERHEYLISTGEADLWLYSRVDHFDGQPSLYLTIGGSGEQHHKKFTERANDILGALGFQKRRSANLDI